jgi:phosphoesterase RecJ-like protein
MKQSPAAPVTASPVVANNHRPSALFVEALRGTRRPMIFGHVTPDADCLGAAFGLAELLRENQADARVVLPQGAVARRLRFMLDLAGARVVMHDLREDADSVVVVDTAGPKRVNVGGGFESVARFTSFNIDHHITNPDFAVHNWVDPHASSTSELIARLADVMGWRVNATTASLLYAGIHGDTAGFSLPNTTADALHTAAELIRAGADVTNIGERLCRSQDRHDFELLRRVYDHTRVTEDGLIAYSYLTLADIRESGCSAEDIDDQVSIPRALRGIQIAMLFSEGEPGVVRVNLRGEGQRSVVEIAQQFGGGGHSQAAGVRVRNKPIEAVLAEVLAAAQAHLLGHSG